MHGRWLAGTIAGMCYALVMYRRGELGDAISAHAITNAHPRRVRARDGQLVALVSAPASYVRDRMKR